MGKQKKKSKKRGSREHGRGRKKGRGAGIRGGRGNAGAGGHRRTAIFKEHGTDYFGSSGFTRPQKVIEETVTCNVGDLLGLKDDLTEEGFTEEDGDVLVIDLDAAGYDKLLGGGRVHEAYRVRVEETTDKAVAKIEETGGDVEILESDDEEASEETEADEPSDE